MIDRTNTNPANLTISPSDDEDDSSLDDWSIGNSSKVRPRSYTENSEFNRAEHSLRIRVNGIVNPPPPPPTENLQLTVDSFESASEVNEDGFATFKVTLSGAAPSGLSIPVRLKASSQAARQDLVGIPASVSTKVGQTTGTVTFRIRADTSAENDETLVIEVHDLPAGVVLTPSEDGADDIVIKDLPSVQVGPAPNLLRSINRTLAEGATLTLTAELSQPAPMGGVTVPIEFVTQKFVNVRTTAVEADLCLPSITVAAGETTGTGTLTVVDDDLHEGEELAHFRIGTVTGHTPLDGGRVHSVTITDNDAGPSARPGSLPRSLRSARASPAKNAEGFAGNPVLADPPRHCLP